MFDFNKLALRKTPFYYYDIELLQNTLDAITNTAQNNNVLLHYAVKANSEPKLLKLISSKGLGADCVSGNEISRCIECGFAPESIVFAGVGKTDEEIVYALEQGIGTFNCESLPELHVIAQIASKKGLKAPVCLRVNPNVDAHTHEYITTGLEENKFGVSDYDFDEAIDIFKNSDSLIFKGLHFHIGSQITDPATIFRIECERAIEIVNYFESKGLTVNDIDLGGGLGIDYENPDENPIPDFKTWIETIAKNFPLRNNQKIHIEPGRSIVAQCGSLISRVLYIKEGREKTIMILDAGMNDLIRPALYGAYHKIENLSAIQNKTSEETQQYDIVGPICESTDVWIKGQLMPKTKRGDIIAIRSAGAYGATMSSRYNLRDIALSVFSDEL